MEVFITSAARIRSSLVHRRKTNAEYLLLPYRSSGVEAQQLYQKCDHFVVLCCDAMVESQKWHSQNLEHHLW